MTSNDEIRERIKARIPNEYFKDLDILDGWLPIVDELDQRLAAIYPDYKVAQVKEKFGGLRYYTEFEPEGFYDLISEAEERSFGVCEKCGTTEDVTTAGVRPQDKWSWIKTLCAECRAGWKPWWEEQEETP